MERHLPIVMWSMGHLRSPHPGTVFSAAALLATLGTVTGMALLGTFQDAGYFYVASMVVGTPVLFAMRPWEAAIPTPIRIYAALYAGFLVMCVAHVLFRDASPSTIEYAGRFLAGLTSGFFFFLLFGGNREAMFRFTGVVAGAHAAVAIIYTLSVGFDFESLSPIGPRVGGNTNPIPYSMLYLTSAGIAALALVDRIRPDRKYLLLVAVAVVLGASLLASVVSASRGTIITLPVLYVLVAALLWLRLGLFWGLGALAVMLMVYLPTVAPVFLREPALAATTVVYVFGEPDLVENLSSSSVRYDLWIAALALIPEQPLFGHGLSSVPEVLHLPVAEVEDDSLLFTFNHFHNEYLDILAKAGIVGAVLFYAPMAVALWVAWRKLKEPTQLACALAVVWVVGAYSIYGLSSVMFSHASTTLQFGIYVGLLIFALAGDGKEYPSSVEVKG